MVVIRKLTRNGVEGRLKATLTTLNGARLSGLIGWVFAGSETSESLPDLL
jgi:hypothetical protein